MSTFFEKTIQISKNTIFILCNIDNKCFFFLPQRKTASLSHLHFQGKIPFSQSRPGLSAWPICMAYLPGSRSRPQSQKRYVPLPYSVRSTQSKPAMSAPHGSTTRRRLC